MQVTYEFIFQEIFALNLPILTSLPLPLQAHFGTAYSTILCLPTATALTTHHS